MGRGWGEGAGEGLRGGARVFAGAGAVEPGGPALGVEEGGGGPESAGGVEEVELDPGEGAPGCTEGGGGPPGPGWGVLVWGPALDSDVTGGGG